MSEKILCPYCPDGIEMEMAFSGSHMLCPRCRSTSPTINDLHTVVITPEEIVRAAARRRYIPPQRETHSMIGVDICHTCHWRNYLHGKPRVWRYKDGRTKVLGCSNITTDGWDFWVENNRPPEKCQGYVKEGDYKPASEWETLGIIAANIAIGQKIDEEGKP